MTDEVKMDDKKSSVTRNNDHWERDLLNRLSFASLNEQRRARRWNVFFKLLLVVYVFSFLAIYMADEFDASKLSVTDHTAMIDISGVIAAGQESNAEDIIESLRDAFEDKNTRGVVLRLNTPGGSPVQSAMINDEIGRLKALHEDVPVYAVIEDICASGGYYIAVASDEIYADKGSIVGSIGVRMDGFGFVAAMEKLGVERRLLTAGEHKALLDPFVPKDPLEEAHLQAMLDEIHGQFIQVVKAGRGERLKQDPKLFSGFIWTGEKAVELGLVDGLGSVDYVARERVKAEKVVDFTLKKDVWQRFAERIGTAMGDRVISAMGVGSPQLK